MRQVPVNINKAGILKNPLIVPLLILSLFSSCTFNKKLAGNIYYDEHLMPCTLVSCSQENPCCNECANKMLFISGQDTLQLCGAWQDTSYRCSYTKCDTTITKHKNAPLSCRGTNCGLNCHPFQNGKRYEITGHYLPKSKFYSYPNFKFVRFVELE